MRRRSKRCSSIIGSDMWQRTAGQRTVATLGLRCSIIACSLRSHRHQVDRRFVGGLRWPIGFPETTRLCRIHRPGRYWQPCHRRRVGVGETASSALTTRCWRMRLVSAKMPLPSLSRDARTHSSQ